MRDAPKAMSDAEMHQNKEGIMQMLDDDVSARAVAAEDYNGKFRKHEKTPFQPPTATSHSFSGISQERWDSIFGKKKKV